MELSGRYQRHSEILRLTGFSQTPCQRCHCCEARRRGPSMSWTGTLGVTVGKGTEGVGREETGQPPATRSPCENVIVVIVVVAVVEAVIHGVLSVLYVIRSVPAFCLFIVLSKG